MLNDCLGTDFPCKDRKDSLIDAPSLKLSVHEIDQVPPEFGWSSTSRTPANTTNFDGLALSFYSDFDIEDGRRRLGARSAKMPR